MIKKIRILLGESFKKPARSDLMDFKALELPHGPGHERLIDVPKHRIQRRWCESPIVRDPPPKERIEQLGDVVQRSLRVPTDVQLPNRLSHGLHCRGADCRIESAKQCVIPDTFHQTRPKTVPKKVKFDVRIGTFSLPVFAINDLRFRRMQFQVALRQSTLKGGFKGRGLGLGAAMDQPVISIPTPWELRVCPRHPQIERVVQKSV